MKNKLLFSLCLLSFFGVVSCGASVPGPQGEQGIQGPAGPAGPQGDKGETGDKGDAGDKGEQGEPGKDGLDGDKGDVGKSVLTGTTDPENIAGRKDDIYVNTTSWDVFVKNTETWEKVGNIKGDKGQTGDNGVTPHIGDNGNWWIGDVDTNIQAEVDITNDPNVSDGFTFNFITLNHKAGLIATDYQGTDKNVIMPNTINNVPVVATADNIFDAREILSIKYSSNLVNVGRVFDSTIKTIDLSNTKVTKLNDSVFSNCSSLTTVKVPTTLKEIADYAFNSTRITRFDFSNVETIGTGAFSALTADRIMDNKGADFPIFYIPKTVKRINNAFDFHGQLLLEDEQTNPNYSLDSQKVKPGFYDNVKQNDHFRYVIDEKSEVKILQDINKEENLIIPAEIDKKPVTSIGELAFARFYGGDVGKYVLRENYDYNQIIFPDTMKDIPVSAFEGIAASLMYFPKSINTSFFDFQKSYSQFNGSPTLLFEHVEMDDPILANYRVVGKNNFFEMTKDKYFVSDNDELLIKNDKNGYTFYGFMQHPIDDTKLSITEHNNLPINAIGSYAIEGNNVKCFNITGNIKTIDERAIQVENLFIADTVETITPYSVHTTHLYLNADYKWNPDDVSSVHQFTNKDMVGIEMYGDLVFYNLANTSYVLTRYIQEDTTIASKIIKIPRTINNKAVTKIDSYCFKLNMSTTYRIYIPKEITSISDLMLVDFRPSDDTQFFVERKKSDYPNTGWTQDHRGWDLPITFEATLDY